MEKLILNSVIDPYSIMAINKSGKLRKLYCPFRVLCMEAIGPIAQNSWCYVETVVPDTKHLFVYSINSIKYPYSHFHIYISF